MKLKKIFTKEAKIGLISIVSLALLYFGINYLKGVDLFKPSNKYYVSLPNVTDLTLSSPIYIEGFKIGLVRDINYNFGEENGQILVDIALEKDIKINKGSYFVLEKTLMSGSQLSLKMNKHVSSHYQLGDTIEGRMASDILVKLENDILPTIESILPKLDSIMTGIQTVVNHPALTQSLAHIERTTSTLEQSSVNLNKLLTNDVPVIVSDLKTITGNFTEISGTLKTLDITSTINSVNATLANLQQTTEKINAKDNTLGLLLNDTTLYLNINNMINSTNELMIDFKKNPKRYVRFSVF